MNCRNFFRQIYSSYGLGFWPHILQISLNWFPSKIIQVLPYLNLNQTYVYQSEQVIKLRFWLKNNLADI